MQRGGLGRLFAFEGSMPPEIESFRVESNPGGF